MSYFITDSEPTSSTSSSRRPKTSYRRVSGLVSGHRYFSPEIGRWISRDPIGEDGGLMLYCITYNNCIDDYDALGMSTFSDWLCQALADKDKAIADGLRRCDVAWTQVRNVLQELKRGDLTATQRADLVRQARFLLVEIPAARAAYMGAIAAKEVLLKAAAAAGDAMLCCAVFAASGWAGYKIGEIETRDGQTLHEDLGDKLYELYKALHIAPE